MEKNIIACRFPNIIPARGPYYVLFWRFLNHLLTCTYVLILRVYSACINTLLSLSLAPSLQLLLGKHLKAGVVVWLLTQCSLFVGWGTYMNIGTVATNYMR